MLELSPAEFRAAADAVADAATAFLETLDDRPVRPPHRGDEVAATFGGEVPERGLGAEALKALDAVADRSRAGNGRFFAYVAGSGEPVGALADFYASVINQNATAWRSSPAAIAIEHTVVRWIAEAIGCPGFTGSLTSGGSAATLMALAMARETRLPANEDGARPGMVYASDEVHMATAKAMALLGLGRANLRLLPADEEFRLRPSDLEAAIAQDEADGRTPIAVVASAGTVNTGAIDPMREIAAIARRHGVWLHVDGAYGAPAAIAEPEWFDGMELADSIALDAHKWLYQPFDCSMLLYRDQELARRTFGHTGDYARVVSEDPIEGFAFFEESIELSRRFRALKLWLSLRWHGLDAFRAAIRKDLEHARLLARLIEAEPSLEVVAPPTLSAVCFRARDADNAQLLAQIVGRGRVYLSNATIHGEFALRACITNHRTTDADVRAIVDELRSVTSS